MEKKKITFTSEEVIKALMNYAGRHKGLKWKKCDAMWRKNKNFSVVLTLTLHKDINNQNCKEVMNENG